MSLRVSVSLVVLAGLAFLLAVGAGCGDCVASVGWVRLGGLEIAGCGSCSSTSDLASAGAIGNFCGLGYLDGCGLGFGAVWCSERLLARALVSIGSRFAWLLLRALRRDVRRRWLAG